MTVMAEYEEFRYYIQLRYRHFQSVELFVFKSQAFKGRVGSCYYTAVYAKLVGLLLYCLEEQENHKQYRYEWFAT